jgi:hypothetical protein
MWYGDKKIAKDMTKEQLENKFEFGLTYLNIGTSIMSGNFFKHKDLAKRKDPQWPIFMNLFVQPSLQILNFSVCNMTKNDVELLAYSLNENPTGKSTSMALPVKSDDGLGAITTPDSLKGTNAEPVSSRRWACFNECDEGNFNAP